MRYVYMCLGDTQLALHFDNAEVTLNVNLGTDYKVCVVFSVAFLEAIHKFYFLVLGWRLIVLWNEL